MPDDSERCYVSAMRILKHRFNSEAELRKKLARKEFDPEVVSATIEKLRRETWLDDQRFAASFVRARVRKGLGRHRISRELNAAGVDEDTAVRALHESVPDHDERAAAVTSARKRLLVIRRREDDTAKIRQKLVAYLFRQGYDGTLAMDVVREVMREE